MARGTATERGMSTDGGIARDSPVADADARASGTQSIERMGALLRELAENSYAGLRLVDLAARVGLRQPTAHRILKSLVALRMVMQSAENRRYYLGHALYEFGLAASRHFSLREMCGPALDRIAQKTGDTVFLTVRSGDDAVCIERREGAFPIKAFTLNVGDRRPLGIGAGGLVILSALPDDEVDALVARHAAQLALYGNLSVPTVMGRVRRTKELGYALHDARGAPGVKVIGMAIRNVQAQPVGAISISAIANRMGGKRREEIVKLLKSEIQGLDRLNLPAVDAPQSRRVEQR